MNFKEVVRRVYELVRLSPESFAMSLVCQEWENFTEN